MAFHLRWLFTCGGFLTCGGAPGRCRSTSATAGLTILSGSAGPPRREGVTAVPALSAWARRARRYAGCKCWRAPRPRGRPFESRCGACARGAGQQFRDRSANMAAGVAGLTAVTRSMSLCVSALRCVRQPTTHTRSERRVAWTCDGGGEPLGAGLCDSIEQIHRPWALRWVVVPGRLPAVRRLFGQRRKNLRRVSGR